LQVSTLELEENGKPKRYLVFDNEAFDYELSESDLSRAIMYCGDDPQAKKTLHGEIQKHFLDCLEEFLGFPVTLSELVAAIREGKLEKKQ
jgi:hypothetical protein